MAMRHEGDQFEIVETSPSLHATLLIDLFKAAFGESVSAEDFEWKYLMNPLGQMRVWTVWERASGRLVASYGAFRKDFWYRDALIAAYQRADSMVHPEFQRRGLFQRMLSAMNEGLKADGALFQFGYSNDRSAGAIRKRADGVECFLSRSFVLPLGARNALDRLGCPPWLTRLLDSGFSPPIRFATGTFLGRSRYLASLKPVNRDNELDLACDCIENWLASVRSKTCLTPGRSR